MRQPFALNLLHFTLTWIVSLAAPYTARAESPTVFLLDGAQLQLVQQSIADGTSRFEPALAALLRDADRALAAGPYSVVNKDVAPPSGDKHDYMSMAPYWWPNPQKKDGLPYIHRDGERNPEIYKARNRHDLGELSDSLETLSLAFYFTRDEKYADRASLLIRGLVPRSQDSHES